MKIYRLARVRKRPVSAGMNETCNTGDTSYGAHLADCKAIEKGEMNMYDNISEALEFLGWTDAPEDCNGEGDKTGTQRTIDALTELYRAYRKGYNAAYDKVYEEAYTSGHNDGMSEVIQAEGKE